MSSLFFAPMRPVIAIMFLLILSFQVLPIKAVAKLLSNPQATEEVHNEGGFEDTDSFIKLFTLHSNTSHNYYRQIEFLSVTTGIYIHFAASIPDAHITEVFTPPPNC
jgi:hypothetical protein